MNSFTSEWLALREPVDHRSRNARLLRSVTDYLKHVEALRPGAVHIIDLGCGSGSNLRALAPVFNDVQEWTLVDSDLQLLYAAQTTLLEWSDDSMVIEDGSDASGYRLLAKKLILNKNKKKVHVHFQSADLFKEVHLPKMATADLVTAAAFFDLTSEDWLQKFCAVLCKPLYATLSYNGLETWQPPGPWDLSVLQAFHVHQTTDKGFGTAAGPDAANLLVKFLTDRAYSVSVAESPWVMDERDRPLMDQLALGIANAVRETKLLPVDTIAHWLHSKSNTKKCVVGHTDVFACP
jgi:hypothetical protein